MIIKHHFKKINNNYKIMKNNLVFKPIISNNLKNNYKKI